MRSAKTKVNPILLKQIENLLVQTIVDINDAKDAEKFLKSFLKLSEYEMLVKRLAIIYWLKKKRSYTNIKKNLQVSSATIASVQQNMEKEGIKMAIKNLEADEWANKWAEKIKKITKKRLP